MTQTILFRIGVGSSGQSVHLCDLTRVRLGHLLGLMM